MWNIYFFLLQFNWLNTDFPRNYRDYNEDLSEKTPRIFKSFKQVSADSGILFVFMFNIKSSVYFIVLIVTIIRELLSLSLEVPVYCKYWSLLTLLVSLPQQQGVHLLGVPRRAAELEVEERQHDQDEEDDDAPESNDDENSDFVVGIFLE